MSYGSAIARVTELRDRLGIDSGVRTIGSQGFDQVLATARNRFGEGPTRIVTNSEIVERGARGTSPNVAQPLPTGLPDDAEVRARIKPLGGSASASLAGPGFATPSRVHGYSPQMKQMVDAASERFGVPRELVIAVSRAESAFRSEVRSPAGATGLMQLMPATARGLGVTDITDPWQNLAGGTRYLRQMLDQFGGDVRKALAGYNAGPGAVAKFGGVPPYSETRTYVARVLDYAAELGWKPGMPT